MQSILELTDKSAKQLKSEMLEASENIEKFADEDNQAQVEKYQKKLIQLATAFGQTGTDLFDENGLDSLDEDLADIAYEVQEAQASLKDYKFELVSEEDVEKQEALVLKLTNDINKAKGESEGQKDAVSFVDNESISNAQTLDGEVENLKEDLEQSRESASKLSDELSETKQQLEKALEEQEIKIKIEPNVEPEEFAKNVTDQLTTPATIEVKGVISSPDEFASDINKQLENVAVQTSDNTQEAASAIQDEGSAAKTAAEYKEEFVKANQEVAISAKETEKATKKAAKGIQEEGDSAKDKEKALKNFMSAQKGSDGTITKMRNTLNSDKFSDSRALNYAQDEKYTVNYNSKSKAYEVSSELSSNYKKLGEAIAKSDAELIKLYSDIQKNDDRGINNDATLEKLDLEFDKNVKLVETWNKLKNDQGQLLGANENEWLKALRDEAQLKAQLNIQEKESIEIANAHAAAIEENNRRDEQAAKEREQILQTEQKMQRAIEEAETQRLEKETADREKALQTEQKYRKAIEDDELKRITKEETAREKSLQTEQKYRKAIEDAELKWAEKEYQANEKSLEMRQKIVNYIANNYTKETFGLSAEEALKSISDMQDKLSSLLSDTSISPKFKESIGAINSELDEIKPKIESAYALLQKDPYDVNAINQISSAMQDLIAQTKTYNDITSNSTNPEAYTATREEVRKLDNQISSFLDQNSAASKRFKEQLLAIQTVLRNTVDSGDYLSKFDLSIYSEKVNEIESEVRSLHQTGNSFFTSLRKQLQSANAQFIGTYFSIQDIIRYAKQVFD